MQQNLRINPHEINFYSILCVYHKDKQEKKYNRGHEYENF